MFNYFREINKQKDGKILIYQRKSNIERKLIIEKEFKDSNLLPNLYMTTIVTSWIDEKEQEIFKICKGKEKVNTLIDIYKSNIKHNRKSYNFYIDGSLKKSDNAIIMAMDWVLIDQNEDNLVLEEFSAKNFGWPSSTKAEIVAILSAILTVKPDSKVLIYTDSNNVVSQYNQFKSELSN